MSHMQGAKFLIPFGSVFLAVGVGFGVATVRGLLRAEAMRTWQETPATVLTCVLKRNSDSDGGSTYRVEATYAYEVAGRRYTGNRVSLHTGSDNIGSFHQRTYAALDACRSRNEPARCWVNPADPSESVLNRKPRPELILFMQVFTFVFGGAGLAVVLAGVSLLVQRARAAANDGLIRMRGTSTHRVVAAVALLWNGYAGWLLWTLTRVLAPDPVPWHLWPLAVIGAVLAATAGYLLGRFRKFGISEFALSPAPGAVGGPVTGMIRIPARVEPAEGFELRLSCSRRYTTRNGGESSTRTETRWEDWRHAVTGYSYGEDTQVPVRFTVPPGLPETSEPGSGDVYFWRLTATARAPGIDYKAVFDVPVKRTAQSATLESAGPRLTMPVQPASADEAVERLSLRLTRQHDGGLELVFPAARGVGMLLFLAAFATAWTGICYVLWSVVRAPRVFPFVFTLFDGLLWLIVCDMALVTRGIVLDRVRRECVVWQRMLGLTLRERRVPFGELLAFRCERSGESGNTVYFRITLLRQNGRPLTIGNNLTYWNDAERVSQLLTDGIS